MLNKTAKTIIVTAARGSGLPADTIAEMLAVADGRARPKAMQPVLLTQAEKARQLGVSRFTIRKLVKAKKLTALELLPGFVRYRADELL